jgi:hypothetical protein
MHTWLLVLFYSGIGCIAMVARDILATVLTKAIAEGKHKLAGNMDGLSDIVNIVLAAFSGVNLIHLGWPGWLGILPIGLVGKLTTERASKWSHENVQEEES